MKNKVTASRFLAWYFSDGDTIENLGQRCLDMIKDEGLVVLSARQLFDECGYIPNHICEEFYDEDGSVGYSPEEVEFIQD